MKVKKDNEIIEMSKDTYESMYKRLGYEIVSEKKVEPKKIEEPEKIEEVEEEVDMKKNKKK